jgi:hypothetical protein
MNQGGSEVRSCSPCQKARRSGTDVRCPAQAKILGSRTRAGADGHPFDEQRALQLANAEGDERHRFELIQP